MIPISSIQTNPNNPRKITAAQVEKLKKSISEFSAMMELRPIIIDEQRIVLGGNMRLLSLIQLGYTEIPESWVKQAADLTDEEKQRFIIADNVGFGEWDWEALANEWDAGDLADWGLDVPDTFGTQAEAEEDEYEMPEEVHTDIVLGDLFEIGEHRLLCGDSTDSDAVARLMNGEKADMVFTDPPYGIDYSGGRTQVVQSKSYGKLLNDNLQGIELGELISNVFLFNKIN